MWGVSMERKMPPIRIEISPYYNGKFIGLNWWRNAHPYEQNSVKRIYTTKFITLLAPFISNKLDNYKVTYLYYYKNERTDLANCCAMMDKFFQDALIKSGITSNDNVKKCKLIEFRAIEKDVDNPRVEIIVEGDDV